MATIREVAKVLGLSERAVRLRIDALDGALDVHVRRGPNNRLELTEEAIAILRRLEEVRQTEGIPLRQAASRIRAELNGDGQNPSRQTDVKPPRQTASNVHPQGSEEESQGKSTSQKLLWVIVILLGIVAVELAWIGIALWGR